MPTAELTQLSQFEVDERFRALVLQAEEADSIASFVLPDGKNVGPYKQWIREWTGLPDEYIDVVNVADGEKLSRDPKEYALIIGTGSRHMTNENEKWMQETILFKRAADEAGVVQYDICFMHQLRAEAQGGATADSGEVRFGVGEIVLTGEGRRHRLYEGLPDRFVVFQSNNRIVTEPGSINGIHAVELATSRYRNEALLTGETGLSGQHHPEGRVDIWEALAYKKRKSGGLLVPDKYGDLVTPSDEQFAEIVTGIKADGIQAQKNGQTIGRNLVKMAGARRLSR
jgi:GMP synthase (glutamine-hydrolysing)